MKSSIKSALGILAMLIIFSSCKKTTYTLGDLTPPTNVVITTEVQGQDASHPNGDGSGNVKISITSDYALSYKVDYDLSTPVDLVYIPSGSVTHKYTSVGLNTYTITAVVYGKGGVSTSVTKDVSVQSDFIPDAALVTNLTNDASKSWIVDKSVPGQLGVGPWTGSAGPDWWAAGVNEKVACCNCFYTATFVFTKVSATSYSLQVTTPDGAFTKTGNLTTLPGIPATGEEGCYNYGGGSSAFSLVPSSTGIASSLSTQTSISLAGKATFIGYGAVLKEYEILSITPTAMYLRVQGTETGNAWYIKLKAN
ncbi:MAG: hypothetical protein ABI594_10880 [Ginsengibacter sp.]